MRNRWLLAAFAPVVLVSVVGCGGSSSESSGTVKPTATREATKPTQSPTAADASRVNWDKYDPSVQVRIDELAAAKDCAGLQDAFDTADANSDITKARTGSNSADLMSYIDAQMRAAGCYG